MREKMDRQNDKNNPYKLAEAILGTVMQAFAEYSFVHTPEQLQELITEPDTDPLFLQEVKEDIVEILTR